MSLIGVDIGGANLKFSDGGERHCSCPFELWRHPDQLAAALQQQLGRFPRVTGLAVTMTGELCDCFDSRAIGVARIVNAVMEARVGVAAPVFYQLGGRFVAAPQAVDDWAATAAANWEAIARFIARELSDETGWVLDLGSTTTDLVPFSGGGVQAQGRSDFERLQLGELVYLGAARTTLSSILPEFAVRGRPIGLASEWFAALNDVFVLCGDLPERPGDFETCDGRPLTRACSLRRLARMLCTAPEEAGEGLILELAGAIKRALLQRLERALARQTGAGVSLLTGSRMVVSGSGEWLARILLRGIGWNRELTSWSESYGPEASTAAAAFAVARLAQRPAVR